MSRPLVAKIVIVVTMIVAGLCGVSAQGQESKKLDLSREIPGAAVQKALRSGSPESFARALVGAGLPVGIIIAWPPAPPPVSASAEPASPASVSVRAALSDFAARHPNQVASVVEGMVYVRHRGATCDTLLQRKMSLHFTGSAIAFLEYLDNDANPAAGDGIPPGLVFGGGSPNKASADLFTRTVTVNTDGLPLRDGMASFARQLPGVAWGIREIRSSSGKVHCQLSLLTATDTAATSYEVK